MSYYVARDGNTVGPLPEQEVMQYLHTGGLVAADLCWTEGMSGWMPLGARFGMSQPLPSPQPFQQPVARTDTSLLAPVTQSQPLTEYAGQDMSRIRSTPALAREPMPTAEINPYAPPASRQLTRPENRGTAELATHSQRLLAALADGAMPFVCMLPGILLSSEFWKWLSVAAFVWMIFYQLYLVRVRGQTIGKKLLHIRIVNKDNGELPGINKIIFMRNLVPQLISMIPLLGAIFALADFLWIFREERRCLHDVIAGTIVVQCDPSA